MLLNRERADELIDREQVEALVVSTPINTYYVPHPGGGIHDFELVDGMVIICDLPWFQPEIGKFHFEDLIYMKEGEVEVVNDADGRLFSCVGGRTYRVE